MKIMEIAPLLPDATCLAIRGVEIRPGHITLHLASRPAAASCPVCHRRSARMHSHYTRHLTDLPWQGVTVRVELHVRRLFCGAASCSRRIFTERLPNVVAAYGRRTLRLDDTLGLVGMALGGEPGARVANSLAMPTSPDTILRLICSQPLPVAPQPRVLGVDDWSWHRGRRYGTILCDLERHRPLDLLPERSAEQLAAWLTAHPGVRIVSRDRGGIYAKGAATGAPRAQQVADRFHLLKNLRKALVRLLDRLPTEVSAAAASAARQPPNTADSHAITAEIPPPAPLEPSARDHPTMTASRARRLELYNRVIQFRQLGLSAREIGRRMDLYRGTVGRFLRASSFPERAARKYMRRTGPFLEYLRQRWSQGCHNAAQLTRELGERGYDGSHYIVKRTVAPWRTKRALPPSPSSPALAESTAAQHPSANQVAWLLTRPEEDCSADDLKLVAELKRHCHEVKVATALVLDFMAMVKHRRYRALAGWKRRAHRVGVPKEIRTFADGLDQDGGAVSAALRSKWSNGQVEGQINRLKLLKRQMYGRAGFDLLRHRVLHAS